MTRVAPGRTASAMATDRRPPGETGPQDSKAEREAKLAEALRANLRRRKAEPQRRGASGGGGPKAEGGETA